MPKMYWNEDLTATEPDPDKALEFARIKHVTKRTKIGPYKLQTEHQSIIAMMYFSVWAKLPLVLLTPEEPSDYGEDFEISGFKINVKSTVYPSGGLILPYGYRYKSDVYVLIIVDPFDLRHPDMKGWAWFDDLARCPVRDYNDRGAPAPYMKQQQLKPMDTFYTELAKMNEENAHDLQEGY